jgi:hypothetical protein
MILDISNYFEDMSPNVQESMFQITGMMTKYVDDIYNHIMLLLPADKEFVRLVEMLAANSEVKQQPTDMSVVVSFLIKKEMWFAYKTLNSCNKFEDIKPFMLGAGRRMSGQLKVFADNSDVKMKITQLLTAIMRRNGISFEAVFLKIETEEGVGKWSPYL